MLVSWPKCISPWLLLSLFACLSSWLTRSGRPGLMEPRPLVARSVRRGPIMRLGRLSQHIAWICPGGIRKSMTWTSRSFGNISRSPPTLSSGSRSALQCCVVSVLSRACRFAGDEKRVGVATSRVAQILFTGIQRLESTGIKLWLNEKKLAAVLVERELLLPSLKAAPCNSRTLHVLVDDVRLLAC